MNFFSEAPLFETRSVAIRYGLAFVLVALVGAARFALVPVAGAETPLLPFVVAIYLAASLAGFGPALLATAISPVVATLLFARISGPTQAIAWAAHVVLFAAVGIVISVVTRGFQRSARTQQSALLAAREAQTRANTTEARLQAIIHDQRASDLALQNAVSNLSYALRAGRAGTFEWNIAENKSVWSAELQQLYGFRPGEFPGKHDDWLESIVPDDRERMAKTVEESLLSGNLAVDYRIRQHESGEIRWVHGRGEISYSADGRPMRMTGINVDITELKRTEEALRDSEERLRLVADHMPVLISYVDREERFQFTNAVFTEWFGVQGPAVVGRQIREILGPQTYQVREPHVQSVLSGEFVRIQQKLTHCSLGERECEITYVPDMALNGDVRGFYVMVQDITERVTADRRKDDFLAMLAHELRNPIAPIRNVANLLSTGRVSQSDVQRVGEMLVRQTSQLAHLVDDLLDAARITRGVIALKRETVLLDDVINTAVETVQPAAELKNQRIVHESPQMPAAVFGDLVRLRQVFENLLTNAVKFSPANAVIRVFQDATTDPLEIRVKDDGIGIDAKILPHVFDLFLQADRSLDRSRGGLGIGLTIVKHLVELHGGSVEARSDGLGCGSEFVVRLPVVRAVAAQDPSAAKPGVQATSRRVLIVEDNVDSAETLTLLLRVAGHVVQAVHDGPTALETLNVFDADVVLLDIGLPGMDGYVVAQEVRRRFQQRPMRLFALTGYGRDEDRALAHAAGFDRHLTKPVDPATLLALMQ